jgi:hypothetical protein
VFEIVDHDCVSQAQVYEEGAALLLLGLVLLFFGAGLVVVVPSAAKSLGC